ncbi:MAG: hypothetical protein GX970_02665 [Phyllobacteriaceae bacterium]|nr:hypothetical protein [Phyllobacteriaceae bacterium]
MVRPESDREDDGAGIVLTPDMRPSSGRPIEPAERAEARPSRLPFLLGVTGAVFGLAALGITGWSYVEDQREIRRLATEVAQLRLSLDLYARGSNAAETDAPAATTDPALTDLANRLAILEQNWRGNAVPSPTTTAPAAVGAQASPDDADCLPSGMRLLVAAGDSYPICGQPASVNIGQVDNGYIVLSDGTAVASGGSMPLPNSACTIGVTSSGDEGLTGYAEIRVSC